MPFICFCTLGWMIFICITEPAVFHMDKNIFIQNRYRILIIIMFLLALLTVWLWYGHKLNEINKTLDNSRLQVSSAKNAL